MATELSRKIHNIMAREMGQMGKFIVKKQCQNIGCEPDEITEEHLLPISKALGKVMITFGGEAKAKKIENEIKKLIHAAESDDTGSAPDKSSE